MLQGFYMGIFTTCGGLSRVIGPIGTSSLYQHYGTYAVYGAILGILAIALIMSIVSFKSFKVRAKIQPELSSNTCKNDTNGTRF
jgi:MFS family permease